jgi:hypothetical protein
MVLQRPVELAGIFGKYPAFRQRAKKATVMKIGFSGQPVLEGAPLVMRFSDPTSLYSLNVPSDELDFG